ncbi:MAG: hypothetical protein GC157_00465 [Frankiales bacterium]|nr:hypothetical protein [Frankiales bacterium]
MFTVSDSVCIDAAPEAVWSVLARLEDIVLWSDAVQSAVTAPGRDRGVGAERICVLRGGITLTERWTHWEEGRSFTYLGSGLPGVKAASNRWTVTAVDGRTLLETRAEVTLKAGRIGRLFDEALARRARGMGRDTLGVLKFLSETGRVPQQGEARDAPVHC